MNWSQALTLRQKITRLGKRPHVTFTQALLAPQFSFLIINEPISLIQTHMYKIMSGLIQFIVAEIYIRSYL